MIVRILITGSDGFVGKNLAVRLGERGHKDIVRVTRDTSADAFKKAVAGVDFVFHLAGVNRPQNEQEFTTGNADFTSELCRTLAAAGRAVPIVFTSSSQATRDNPYGRSKLAAETALLAHAAATSAPVHIFRLPNVFGKWSRPQYNSAVATFCDQVANGKPLTIHDPSAPLRLVYIDDVVDAFLAVLAAPGQGGPMAEVTPFYDTTVGEVAGLIEGFAKSRTSLVVSRVGSGLPRALHSTYLSFVPPTGFAYDVARHCDPRGEFVEMLKTGDSGQLSYFTAHPGITRGEHYHHSKTEKFLAIRGTARFRFRHIVTNETFEIITPGGQGRIVETVPGWAHNVENIGTDELIVMLWANEIFDQGKPDTYACKVDI
jgi:UDP-2-acetamido-2,6-beta-L-arabino-hexul-4-ose reductase